MRRVSASPLPLVSGLCRDVARRARDIARTEGALPEHDTLLIDGTGLSMPNTPENQDEFPQPTSQEPGCGFPQGRMVGLVCAITGVLVDAALSAARGGKDVLGAGVLACRMPEMIVKELWTYLLGYNLIRLLACEAALARGCEPRAISFRHTAQLWSAWAMLGGGTGRAALDAVARQDRATSGAQPSRSTRTANDQATTEAAIVARPAQTAGKMLLSRL